MVWFGFLRYGLLRLVGVIECLPKQITVLIGSKLITDRLIGQIRDRSSDPSITDAAACFPLRAPDIWKFIIQKTDTLPYRTKS